MLVSQDARFGSKWGLSIRTISCSDLWGNEIVQRGYSGRNITSHNLHAISFDYSYVLHKFSLKSHNFVFEKNHCVS